MLFYIAVAILVFPFLAYLWLTILSFIPRIYMVRCGWVNFTRVERGKEVEFLWEKVDEIMSSDYDFVHQSFRRPFVIYFAAGDYPIHQKLYLEDGSTFYIMGEGTDRTRLIVKDSLFHLESRAKGSFKDFSIYFDNQKI